MKNATNLSLLADRAKFTEVEASHLANLLSQVKIDFEPGSVDGTKLLNFIHKSLTLREQIVLLLQFGIPCNDEWDFRQIANLLYVTRERVRQISAKALRKLAHYANDYVVEGFTKSDEDDYDDLDELFNSSLDD